MIGLDELRIFGQLLLAAILGIGIGIEREVTHKAAGMRTHGLVSLGAALFTILSIEGFRQFFGTTSIDPTRVAAQVVLGVGFLGAGLIILREGRVRGLTTAAGIWVAAAIGMAVGVRFYSIAIFTAVLTCIIVGVLRWLNVEKRLRLHSLPQDNNEDKE
ncbi:MAG: MgtC/SapB family protein [bacterium]|nr:MgtC/SapB family protein [bacterium]